MKKILICISMILVGFASISQAADMRATVDAMIKEKIESTHNKYKEAQAHQHEQKRIIFAKSSYDAGISFLQHLLKSPDTELKRKYLLTLFIPELEFEKGNLEFAEDEDDKQEMLKTIDLLKAKIAKLEKS